MRASTMHIDINFSKLSNAQLDFFKEQFEKKYGSLREVPSDHLNRLVEEKVQDKRRWAAELDILSKFWEECLRRQEKERQA